MWERLKGKENQNQSGTGTGDEFERAADRVTAGSDEEATRNAVHMAEAMQEEGTDSLVIRPEWAEAAARMCFLPAARMVHPAYALGDEEAEVISPKMQAFLQAVADKYAPAALSRVASKYPEFLDLAGALGVLYWQKWRYVSHIRQMEAEKDNARDITPAPVPIRSVGDRDEEGRLVI